MAVLEAQTGRPASPIVARWPLLPLRVLMANLFDAGLGTLFLVSVLWQAVLLVNDRPELSVEMLALAGNGCLAVAGFVWSLRRQYPILLAFFFFDFIFLSIAPQQQLRFGFDPVFGDATALWTAIWLCLAFSLFGGLALVARARPVTPRPLDGSSWYARSLCPGFHPAMLSIVVTIASAGLLLLYGRSLFTSREGYFDNLAGFADKTSSLLLTSFLNPLVFAGAVVGLIGAWRARDRGWLAVFAGLLVLAAVINNPIVTARFRASALIAFAVLALVGWRNTRLLAAYLVAGMASSPIFNAFRYENSTTTDARTLDRFFSHIDFDAFAMTCHVVRYSLQNGFSYGDNIASALLFFVPRALWPGKSEHVAFYVWPQVRYYRNVWTNNLSSPPFAEGYFAFGLLGALLMIAVMCWLAVKLERSAEAARPDSAGRLVVCMIPMLSIILLRGPLIVGVSEVCGDIAAVLAAVKLSQVRFRLMR